MFTLSAVQVLALFDKLDVLDVEKVSNCILCLVFWRSFKCFFNVFFGYYYCAVSNMDMLTNDRKTRITMLAVVKIVFVVLLSLYVRCCWGAKWRWIIFRGWVGWSWYTVVFFFLYLSSPVVFEFIFLDPFFPLFWFCFSFSYIAICCLSLLRRLEKINVENAVKYIVSCKNLDGGFGSTPGGESHAGQSKILVMEITFYWLLLWFFEIYI